MKKIITISILLLATLSVVAQTITGKIIDEQNEPLSYVNCILRTLPDSVYVAGTISDSVGNFQLSAEAGKKYTLQFSIIGYKTIDKTCSVGNLGTIVLQEDAVLLEEATVKASRPISKMTASGVQTTVANTILSEMGTGNDVLKRIPMVTGDDGNFNVFGRGAAKIYINNREVRDPSELEQLNSLDIESIEVISNPGALYDATVTAVINIKTVKKQGDGFSFDVRSGFYAWENQDYINILNTNYRKKGLDVFAKIYHSDDKSFQRGEIFQTTKLDTLWQQQNYINNDFHSINLNGTIGANYQINDNHYFGVRYNLYTTPYNIMDTEVISNVDANGQFFDKWKNNEFKEVENKPISQANLYYIGKIEKLSIDFNTDYMFSSYQSFSENVEESIEFGNRTLHSMSNVENQLLASKLLLSYPIWKGSLSAGSEFANIKRNDEYINEDLIGFTSNVNFAEQNLALFTQYQAATKIGNFSAGIRYENANYDYFVNGIKDNEKSRSYGQWFPNASYSNQFGDLQIQLNYNSRVVRPSYRELSNNLYYANRLSIETGNPYLKPSISQNFSLTTLLYFIQAYVSYDHIKDMTTMWIDRYELDPKVSIITYRNIDKLPKFTAFLAIAPSIGIWQIQLSGGVQKVWIDYSEYGLDVDMKKPLFFASSNNTFKFPHEFTVNIDFNYTSKGHTTFIYLYRDSFELNLSTAKTFFNKSLRIRLGIYGILTPKEANMFVMPQTELKNLHQYDKRFVMLSVSYYFNSAKSKYKGSGAGQDAKNRF